MTTILQSLIAHLSPDEKRTGRGLEYYIDCPDCGRTKNLKRCSFSDRGYFCFSCGEGGGLGKLAEQTGLGEREYTPMPRRKENPPEPPPAWILNPPTYPIAVDAWQKYAPILTPEIITEKRLGMGVLPQSACKHARLILPIYVDGLLVGLRGRSLDCDCPKWLAPGGTKIVRYPLYNIEAVQPGSVVLIVENPIDALLIGLTGDAVGVATYSTSYWLDIWADALIDKRPQIVVVAYDNDLPGNGGAHRRDEMIAEWLKTHDRVPKARGIKLANELQPRLPVVLYDWGNAKTGADMGSELC